MSRSTSPRARGLLQLPLLRPGIRLSRQLDLPGGELVEGYYCPCSPRTRYRGAAGHRLATAGASGAVSSLVSFCAYRPLHLVPTGLFARSSIIRFSSGCSPRKACGGVLAWTTGDRRAWSKSRQQTLRACIMPRRGRKPTQLAAAIATHRTGLFRRCASRSAYNDCRPIVVPAASDDISGETWPPFGAPGPAVEEQDPSVTCGRLE